jgi:DNA (cytosine-5)-methyltransferase 1
MKAISLFSGMGGDSLGMVQAGLKLVAYCEKEKVFCGSHDLNFEHCALLGNNITEIPDSVFETYKGDIDVIFAGFPCQGFSNAGKKDVNDVRNTLFREFLRAVTLIRPKFIIGENVKGLLTRKDKNNLNYIDVIVSEFGNIGYDLKYKVIKADKYGVPQKRERLIIIGKDRCLTSELSFPDEITLPELNLKNIVTFNMTGAIKVDEEDFDMTTIPEECILTDMTNDLGEDPIVHPYLRLKVKTRNTDYGEKTHYNMLSFSKRDSPIHCEIIDIRKPAKTIICTYEHQPRLFVPLKNKNGFYLRPLLVDELKQIQGFPPDFKMKGTDKQKIIQIGNAVPPPLIKLIVENLIN